MIHKAFVQGQPNTDMSKGRIIFGDYATVYTKTTNNMKARIFPDISL